MAGASTNVTVYRDLLRHVISFSMHPEPV